MASIIPATKPRLSSDQLNELLVPFNLDRTEFPLVVVGIRGYYTKSMGDPLHNDRNIYDDALFIDTPNVTAAFNGNVDPSTIKLGTGTGNRKGMASLKAGLWKVHQFDKHNNKYLALCQRAGNVTVLRDGRPPYEDTGMFGINIHRGSLTTTSSLGCQTIHPSQWPSFIALAQDQAQRYYLDQWKTKVIPYVLFDGI